MEENEYKDNEKVLYKTRGKLLGKKPEEADCFVTQSHVVIEAEEPIKIPVSHIQNFEFSYGTYPSGTATLTFLDDLNKKHKLSLEMDAVADFKGALAKHVEFPKGFLDKLVDKQILDNIEIKGNKLICPICKGHNFWNRQTLMNTRGATFLGFDWANKEAVNFVCDNCGYVFWFLEK